MATHFHSLRIKEVRKETTECISVAFDIPADLSSEFQFSQGQNITIRTHLEGEEIRRSYSICSSPLEKELRIAIKKVFNGRFSEWANEAWKKGDVVEVLPPTGKFNTRLDPGNKKNYMAIAAGSGITPVLSIIKATLATEPMSHFMLLYGNRNRTSIIFKEELEGIKNKFINRFSLHHILSREKTDSPLSQGRINKEKCDEIFAHLVDSKYVDEFFLCGPEEMIFSVKDYLEAKGVDKRHIHFELFTPPGQHRLASKEEQMQVSQEFTGKTSRVTIKLDGIAIDFDLPYNGEGILDAGLQLGLDLPFACKGGVCASCRAKLVEGAVAMDTNYALEPEEVKAGYILTCQSHPRTDKVLVDFDAK